MMTNKIHSHHLERLAYVYVRQSTLQQVLENQESTQRQYQLKERALTLGWPASQIEVIDEDQGRSGSSALQRQGFQRLVTEIGLGKVGLVLMLEASRLARNNSDWHRLIEICGLSHSLIADEQAVYDARDPNDRLLLGVKGTLSEAELFTLRTRLLEGRWSKARKGQLKFFLPTGYVPGEDGIWELDPNRQVRERLDYLFSLFQRHGVARKVVRELRTQGLDLPVRVYTREAEGALVWKTASVSTVLRILKHPAYAGAYVYGRCNYVPEGHFMGHGMGSGSMRPMEEWPLIIKDHHQAYISWEVFVSTQEQLRQNAFHSGSTGAAREGKALLQGIVVCGVCGQGMKTFHYGKKERRSPGYMCGRAYAKGDASLCQTMTARPVDAAVVEAFLEAASPLSLDVSLQVLDKIEQDLSEQRRQWQLQLEQARYQVRRAERQYQAVDPDNRLVAAELEKRWEEALAQLTQLEQAYTEAEQQAAEQLSAEEREAVIKLVQDLPTIWQADTTTQADRKQLLRLAIESVQLDGVTKQGEIEVQIHWRSGTVTRCWVERPKRGADSLRTSPEALALIAELAPHQTYAEIAEALNAKGWHTAHGRVFKAYHVRYLCRRNGWARGKSHKRPKQRASKTVPKNQGKRSKVRGVL